MTTMTETATQVYRVYIRTTPDRVWDAITSPEWVARYGYGGTVEYDLRPGAPFKAYTSLLGSIGVYPVADPANRREVAAYPARQ